VRSGQIERMAQIIGIAVPTILVFMLLTSSDSIRTVLFVLLGSLLLLLSVRQAYAYRVAEKEVIKQYDFMFRIFRNARRRLDAVGTDMERRRILRALGEAALDEHAEWILLHRERPIEEGSLWRIEA
ncbi:MAG: hypothetical protein PVH89_07940, partial [Gammaproteobacteria bacterium]